MKIVHITGPEGSGKTTALHAIAEYVGREACLIVEGQSTAAGISQALQRNASIRTVLIDEFDPERIDLDAIKPSEERPIVTIYVAHSA